MALCTDSAISYTSTDSTSFVAELPAHVSGDLLIIAVQKDDAVQAITCATSGWEEVSQHAKGTSGSLTMRIAVFAKKATSNNETYPTVSSTDSDTWNVVAMVWKGWNDTGTLSQAFGAKATQDVTAVPMLVGGVTTTAAKSTVMYVFGSWTTKGGVTRPDYGALMIDTCNNDAGVVAVSQKYMPSTGASGDVGHYSSTSFLVYGGGIAIEIKDGSSGTILPPVMDSVITQIDTFFGNSTPLKETVPASVFVSSVSGQGITYKTIVNSTRSGFCPFEDTNQLTPSVNANQYGFHHVLETSKDLTSGYLVGSYRFVSPLDYISMGNRDESGILLAIGDASNNYDCWQIGAFSENDIRADERNVYVIQLNQSTNTKFGTNSSLNRTVVNKVQASARGVRGAVNVCLNQLLHFSSLGLAFHGGGSAYPLTFPFFQRYVGQAFPLEVVKNGVVNIPLNIGYGSEVHIDWSLASISFPKLFDTRNILKQVDSGAYGVTLKAGANSSVILNGTTFQAPEYFYWTVDAACSTSGTTYDFNNMSIVGATVTLRPITTFDNVKFINCAGVTQNGTTVAGGVFKNSKITSDNPTLLTSCSFISGGTGHAIEITTPGTYTLTSHQYTGYGADGTTDAVIYNNSGGAVTLSVSGGDSPTVRNGAGASTTVVAGATLTLSGLATGSDVVIRLTDSETVLASVDQQSGTTWQYAYTSLDTVDISIFKAGYLPEFIKGYELSNSNVTLPIKQKIDRYYLE